MDLRTVLNRETLEEGIKLVQSSQIWYQPFILSDGIEVGEGQNLEMHYKDCESLFDWNVYLSPDNQYLWDGNPRKLADDGEFFAACNRKYRLCYERIADTIENAVGDLSDATILELGCNTGLNLFNLAARGAKSCVGIDWTDHSPVFSWLNRALDTNVRQIVAPYDNLSHGVDEDVPESDIVINTVFLNHQSDPLHALCYLADKAKRGLFLWILIDDLGDQMAITYGDVSGVHDLGAGKPLPLSFHNDIKLSKALFLESLRRLGFEKVDFIEHPSEGPDAPPGGMVGFTMVYAHRTQDVRSAFYKPKQKMKQKGLLSRIGWQTR